MEGIPAGRSSRSLTAPGCCAAGQVRRPLASCGRKQKPVAEAWIPAAASMSPSIQRGGNDLTAAGASYVAAVVAAAVAAVAAEQHAG